VRASIVAEKAGIPAVSFVITDFIPLANHTAKGEGMAGIRIAEYPGSIQTHSDAEIDKAVEERVVDQIVKGLTGQVQEEKTEVTGTDPRDIVFKGTFEEVNEFFYRRGWTDGLPVVPPTVEKIKRFLEYTDRKVDEEIAVLPLAYLRATPWNIAANAIMAGCLPEYMPVLISAVEAISDPEFRLKDIGNTCGCRPFLLIGGPIAKKLGIFSGTGLISPGARKLGATSSAANPNSTIGRALHLIIQNIAGFRPGESEMSVFGHPQTFVIAEDDEENPWEPYRVDSGFDKDTSTVTAMAWMGTIGPESETKGDRADLHLMSIGRELRNGLHPIAYRFGSRVMVAVLIVPPIAGVIAADGYTKREAAQQIFKHSYKSIKEINERLRGEMASIHEYMEGGNLPSSFDLPPDEEIPAVLSPDMINIIVCGSRQRNRSLILYCFYVQPVTREVKIPDKSDKIS